MVPGRLAFVTAACLLIAGCAGGPTSPTTSPNTGPTTPTTDTTETLTTSATTTDDAPAFGTQFVSVEKYENQTIGATWPEEERSTFENLTDARRVVFVRALEDGQQTFGPDEENPFDFNDQSRPRVVEYRDEWYYVSVVIV